MTQYKVGENAMIKVKQQKEFNVFISQPMSGFDLLRIKTDRLICKYFVREDFLEAFNGDKSYELNFLDNLQEDKDPETTHPLEYLGCDVALLAKADVVYFIPGWEKSRGCNIEYQVAKAYNIPMMFVGGSEFDRIKAKVVD